MILEKLLEQPADNLHLYLRGASYGATGQAALLRDVIALANLPGDSARYVFFGVQRNERDELVFDRPDATVLNELESYQNLVRRHIEPGIKVETLCGSVRGNFLAAIKISPESSAPFVIREQCGSELLAGACWVRDENTFRPALRADLDRIYTATLPDRPAVADAVPIELPDNVVQVGFNDDPALSQFVIDLPDVTNIPSVIAAVKMQNQISAVTAASEMDVVDSAVARLSHARLYGSDLPYDERGINTLVEGYNSIQADYEAADKYYLNELQALKLNFCVANTSETELTNLTLIITLPKVPEFTVVEQLCDPPGQQRSSHESDLLGYPKVKYYKNAIQVRQELGTLTPGAQLPLFEKALRLAVQPRLAGRKVAIRYELHADGLPAPEVGLLKLVLRK